MRIRYLAFVMFIAFILAATGCGHPEDSRQAVPQPAPPNNSSTTDACTTDDYISPNPFLGNSDPFNSCKH